MDSCFKLFQDPSFGLADLAGIIWFEVFLDILGLDCNFGALRDLFARYTVPDAAAGNPPQLCHCCSCDICAGAEVTLAASWSPLGQDAGVAKFGDPQMERVSCCTLGIF